MSQRARVRPGCIAGMALAVLVLLTHAPLLFTPGDFTTWDDLDTLAHNPHLAVAGRPASLAGLAALWEAPRGHLYIPLTYTVWWGISLLTDTAAGFKWASVGVHLAVALLLLATLRRTGASLPIALAAAALFAVHPLTVASVAWVSGLKDLLAGAFGLAAIALLVRSRGEGPAALLATLCFAAALLSKPSAITAAPIALLYLALAPLPQPVRGRHAAPLIAVWFAMAAATALLTRSVQPPQPAPDTPRLTVAADALRWHLHHALLPGPAAGPGGPAIDHGRSPYLIAQPGQVTPATYTLALAAVGLTTLGLLRRPTRPIALPLAAAGLAVAPYLGLVPFDFQAYSTVAEHYAYPLLLGLAATLAALLTALSQFRPAWHWAGPALTVPLTLVWAANSHARHAHWHNSDTLYRQTLAANPRSVAALNNLAALALDRLESAPTPTSDDLADAQRHLTTLASLTDPLPPPLQAVEALNRGRLAELGGDLPAALASFARSAALAPDFAEPHFRLARLLAATSRPADAEHAYARALDLHHPHAGANLAALLLAQGRPADAETAARRELALRPDSAPAAGNLAAALLLQNRPDDARIAAQPVATHSAAAANVLGILAARSGNLPQARHHFQTAIRLDPANPTYAQNLARLPPPPPPGP